MLSDISIDYFIITHKILKTNYIFSNTKLLVGQNTDIKNSQYIICKNLPNNIENYPYLCSYTAWYALANNLLSSSKNVSLLEYDIETDEQFSLYNLEVCKKQTNHNYIISYSKTLTNHYVFYKSTPWLEISLKKIHGIDLRYFVLLYKDLYPFWPTTTNVTMPIEILMSFIDWFEPMTKIFRHHPLGAYVHERAFFVFCALNKISILYAPNNLLVHKQECSHQTKDIYGTILNKYNSLYLTNNMITEYDMLYNKELNHLCQI